MFLDLATRKWSQRGASLAAVGLRCNVSPRPRPAGRGFWSLGFGVALALGALGWVLLLASCCTVAPPPFDTSQPGWRIQQGQAIWRPRAGSVELAGELVVATHADGRALVQFSKTPLPLVIAQLTASAWHVEFTPQKRRLSGRGDPPTRFPWLQLPRALRGQPPGRDWTFVRKPDGNWRLENSRTGELLEGFLIP